LKPLIVAPALSVATVFSTAAGSSHRLISFSFSWAELIPANASVPTTTNAIGFAFMLSLLKDKLSVLRPLGERSPESAPANLNPQLTGFCAKPPCQLRQPQSVHSADRRCA